MQDEVPSSQGAKTAAQGRQYFKLERDFSYVTSKPEYVWQNQDEIGPFKSGPREFSLGFRPLWKETPPQILIKKHGKRKPLDIYGFDTAWLISGRLKRLLEQFDSEAFEFVPTQTTYGKGLEVDEPYWLCDVIRVLDCVDEVASEIRYQQNTPRKHYSTLIKAVMKQENVGDSHLFRLYFQLAHTVYCDNLFRNMIHSREITGFWFTHLDGSLKRER